MTITELRKPVSLFYHILLWLNKDARKVLDAREGKFKDDLKDHNKNNPGQCYFFGTIEPKPSRKELESKWNKFENKAKIKGELRDKLIQRLLTISLLSLSVIIVGVHTLPISNYIAKIVLIILLYASGIMFVFIQKINILSLRGSGYKYHLYKIYLEKEYPKDIVPLTIRNRDQRIRPKEGEKEIPREERGKTLSPGSFTDNELLIVFLLRIMFIGAMVISCIIA